VATRFADLVAVSDAVAATRSRSEKIRRIAELLRGLPLDEVAPAVRFLVGRARREAIGVGPAQVHRAAGDASPAAEASLGIADVATAVAGLRATAGAGSTSERSRRLVELFSCATREEQSFIARWLVGELRQGALEGIVVEAVAAAAGIDPETVREALMTEGDLAIVAETAIRDGADALAHRTIRLFTPVLPMLAGTVTTPAEALDRFGDVAAEAKIDGVRVQVHKAGDRVEVYSRKRKRMTDAVPEVVACARRVAAESFILDGEAIALQADGRPEPFQDTMRRVGRRIGTDRGTDDVEVGVESIRKKVPLVARFFDCLLVGEEPRIALPQQRRWQLLGDVVPDDLRVAAIATADRAALDRFVRATLDEGHEGVVLKSRSAPYRAGRRGTEWLKWKPTATLDLVVLAAEWGHGRRKGRLSNIHLGARDPASGAFVMIGKTFKGMTDEMLAWQTERFLEIETRRDDWTVYVEPRLVVEIAFDGAQRSSQYPGGVALRFARVKRYRSDKSAADADTIDLVRKFL
jgi:DNA ligase-1